MKDLPVDERPREKLLKTGASTLSNAELLAIILRTGSRRRPAVGLAQDLLGQIAGLKGLADASVEELMQLTGIGQVKAVQLVALGELTRRMHAARYARPVIESAGDLVDLLMPRTRFSMKEVFFTVLLDRQNQVLGIEEVSKGSVDETIVHPREVFREAVRRSASALLLAHNHPSGNPEPSAADIGITKQLVEGSKLLGIHILDHVILGDGRYVSLKERGII